MTPPAARFPPPALRATYRVQLNSTFTLRDARAIVPYLDRLGISHLYCSPILAARTGSTHGYDVVDPMRVNPELGSVDELRALADDLHARGMGLLLDIVPNHMAASAENPYWEDVLARGRGSRYAKWFDIDWEAGGGKVVLPVLSEELEVALSREELRVDGLNETLRLRYRERSWPLNTDALPDGPGAATNELLEKQHYRLAFWRRAPEVIDYRRFFDVNDLVALRQEDPEVFEETHAFVLSLLRDGVIDALRVDHVDGLADPQGYLEWLRAAGCGLRGETAEKGVSVFVEKILAMDESLRESWPVQGTTGYEFLNDVEDLFLEPEGYAALERGYRRLRRRASDAGDFATAAYQGKVKVLTGPLNSDVQRLTGMLRPLLCGVDSPDALLPIEEGLVQFLACLPVYRTYLDGHDPSHPDDVAAIERAMQLARERLTGGSVLHVVERIGQLLLEPPDENTHRWPQWLGFVRRLQQTSGPAAAKGVEDTALYVDVPLASRNEVGGAPDRPLTNAVARFHEGNAARAARWPESLLTVSTHDTKRSADVRARLDALTECPRGWWRRVLRWRRMNRKHRSLVRGRLVPEGNVEYLLYQTLLGIWPESRDPEVDGAGPDSEWLGTAHKRLDEYLLKAVREAKVRTSWTDPDLAYEKALLQFTDGILARRDDSPFLTDLSRFAERVAPLGRWNALARLVLQLTSPGTPDIYRGDELPCYSLVDPDNRRPIDYARRAELLEEVGGRETAVLGVSLGADYPRSKLLILRRLLDIRRRVPELFRCGSYTPLAVTGKRADQIVAFVRSTDKARLLVVVPRYFAGLQGGPSEGGEALWGNTEVGLSGPLGGGQLRSLFASERLSLAHGALAFRLSDLFVDFPLAVLLSS